MAKKKTTAPAKRGKRRSGFAVKTIRRGKRRAKKGLSEILTPAGAAAAGKNTLMGAAGGAAAWAADKYLLREQQPITRILGHLALAVGGWVLGQPAVGAGAAGASTALLMEDMGGGLNEGGEWADQDALNQLPVFLDEDGNPFALAEDGSQWYLDEAGTPYTLSENGETIYPDYGTMAAMMQ